jgi:DNA-binding CsgD family transcriptional regulator
MKVKIPCHQAVPIYKILASKIKELKVLGLSNNEIALRLKIHQKTVVKGLEFCPNNKKSKC